MKVAVIDGGVTPEFKEGSNIVKDLVVNSDNKVIDNTDSISTTTDHGFNVCKIINLYAPNAEIISIRIFNSYEKNANILALVAALRYCLENEIPFINLSIGTVNLSDNYLLQDVVKRIINNKQIIVAAHSNSKGLSFPAMVPGVYSVRAIESFRDVNYRWGYSFVLPSKHRINIDGDISYTTQIANSYAAPILTAKIYNIMKSKNDNMLLLEDLNFNHHIFFCEQPTFLDDVVIVNPDRQNIYEDILPFNYKYVFNDIEVEVYTRDYIFMPNKNREKAIENLKRFLSTIPEEQRKVRIFYLGYCDSQIEEILNNYRFEFWLLPGDDIYPIDIFDTELSDCSTLYFYGEKGLVYHIMTGLRDAFLQDGFNCLAISDYMDSALYGIYYLKDLAGSKRRKQLEYVLEPDVELVYSKNPSFKEVKDSMEIKCIKDGTCLKLEIRTLNTYKVIEIDLEVDFRILLDKIINMVNSN